MRAALAAFCLLLALLIPRPASAATYYLMLGSRVTPFDHLPVVCQGGEDYVTLALLDELGLAAPQPAEGQDEQPAEHYSPEEGTENGAPADAAADQATEVGLIAPPPPSTLAPPAAGRLRYRLAGHTLDVSPASAPLAAELDGVPLAAPLLMEHAGARYLAAESYDQVGLHLAFNALENLYQVVGLIHYASYTPGESPELVLRCLTPLAAEGLQEDAERVTLLLEGGFFGDTGSRDYPGDPAVAKLGFKTQPDLGRSFVFIRQPRRTGFRVLSDPKVGFARVSFGNYFRMASWQQSSSGEISLNVQLGARCELRHEQIGGPPRLVVDFPGVVYEDATKTIPVGIGRVTAIRVGTPERGTVRVVLDLTEPVDYRVLTKDDGARYFIQLLPPAPAIATAYQRRKGRTIMLDAGHGGSDPGAPGVIGGSWEQPIALAITLAAAGELRGMGYDVLLTRESDRFLSLGQRTDYANAVLPYIFVSIHVNWIERPDYEGVMTFHHPASAHGPRLAACIQQELVAMTGAVDKGVRQANFFVLRETVMPSALVECGFLSHREECRLLLDPAYQRRVAQGIARGIDRYVTGGS